MNSSGPTTTIATTTMKTIDDDKNDNDHHNASDINSDHRNNDEKDNNNSNDNNNNSSNNKSNICLSQQLEIDYNRPNFSCQIIDTYLLNEDDSVCGVGNFQSRLIAQSCCLLSAFQDTCSSSAP